MSFFQRRQTIPLWFLSSAQTIRNFLFLTRSTSLLDKEEATVLTPHSALAPGREKIYEHAGVLHSREAPSKGLSKCMETLQSRDLKTANKKQNKTRNFWDCFSVSGPAKSNTTWHVLFQIRLFGKAEAQSIRVTQEWGGGQCQGTGLWETGWEEFQLHSRICF